ncbi:outer membrane protein assembly factor BamB family protein [Dictyobacter arantiisoli]|uniref:Pyrrolo-quinoline quinone repeat domain-containing protein n=1 Tax=Dictyobacter arantiisoli TaxID=2014874 RepID=A0A5A5TK59_9CHLR|nr:PQQ-binding-like beta-propeller repeat protein [Dictyobacter arantiisoli]GCF11662.1 hypothetical protein KDI_52260 [Dictyobacter arantiisoli]
MNSHDKSFEPDAVDEQVQKLLKKPGPLKKRKSVSARMVQDLQDVYAENASIMDRAWKRIAAETDEPTGTSNRVPFYPGQTGHFGSVPAKQQGGASKRTRRASQRIMNTFALGLVAGLLLASMGMVFTLMKNKQMETSNTTSQGIYSHQINPATGADEIIKRNPTTGAAVWRYSFPAHTTMVDQSLVDQALYAVTTNDVIYAINAGTGRANWMRSLPPNSSREGSLPQKIVGSAHMVAVITSQTVYKLNSTSGRIIGSYAIPAVVNNPGTRPSVLVEGDTFYVIVANNLYAYQLVDGSPRWSQPLAATSASKQTSASKLAPTSMQTYASNLAFADNTVYVASWRPANSVYLTTFDARTGNVLSNSVYMPVFLSYAPVMTQTSISITVHKGIVYGSFTFQDNASHIPSFLFAYDVKLDQALWHSFSLFSSINGQLQFDAGNVYVAGFSSVAGGGSIAAFDGQTGVMKWHSPTDGQVQSLTFQDGVVYVTTNTTTFALNESDGSSIWQKNMSDG